MEKLENWLSKAAVYNPITSLILSLIVMGLCIAGLQYTQFDADPSSYFSEDHEHYRAFKDLEETYGKIDSLLIAVKAKQDKLYTKENLISIESLTEEAWKLPYVTRVDSIANYNYSWNEDDELFVDALISDADSFTEEDVQRVERIARTDPDIVDRLASKDKEVVLLRLIVTLPKENRQQEENEIVDSAYALEAKIKQDNPNLAFLYSGNVMGNHAVTKVATDDIMTSVPMMYLMIFIMLGLLLRSLTAVLSIWVITMLSCAAALGIAAWCNVIINMMSITAINIIITVAIAHCVHILTYFFQLYHQGKEKKEAMVESLKINFTPITLTSVTTALGFLSMNMSKMPPAHDLGNITAVGVGIAFILSLFMLPSMIMLLPVKRRFHKDGGKLNKIMDQLASFVIAKRSILMVVTIGFSVAMLSLAPNNIMNDRFTENVKLPNQFRVDNAEIDGYFGGFYNIEYDIRSIDEGGISEPEYLAHLDKFANWLRQQPEVMSVQVYSDVVKRLNMNMNNDDESFYRLPSTREEAAQYQLMFEMSQPYGTDMSNIIRQDKSGTRVIVNLPSLNTYTLIELQQRTQVWLKENMPKYMYHSGEGLAVMWAYLGHEAIIDGLKGALLALFLISVILTIIFKSIRYGLISLIPNLLPAGVGYGIWALINGELSMGQMLVLSITIGIVVDDSVHFLSKYLRAKRNNNASAEDAVRYAFNQVGPALWITTAVLIVGFGMLLTSGFIPNSRLGLLTMFILGAALILDFFLLPPLLLLIDKAKGKTSKVASQSK